jgi:hypothetical protein
MLRGFCTVYQIDFVELHENPGAGICGVVPAVPLVPEVRVVPSVMLSVEASAVALLPHRWRNIAN